MRHLNQKSSERELQVDPSIPPTNSKLNIRPVPIKRAEMQGSLSLVREHDGSVSSDRRKIQEPRIDVMNGYL